MVTPHLVTDLFCLARPPACSKHACGRFASAFYLFIYFFFFCRTLRPIKSKFTGLIFARFPGLIELWLGLVTIKILVFTGTVNFDLNVIQHIDRKRVNFSVVDGHILRQDNSSVVLRSVAETNKGICIIWR